MSMNVNSIDFLTLTGASSRSHRMNGGGNVQSPAANPIQKQMGLIDRISNIDCELHPNNDEEGSTLKRLYA